MPAFRGHDSARKFHCDVPGCAASFVKRAHLRRHEMTHTQRRDFSCPGCNRAFSRNDSMARHLRRKHPHLYRSQEGASSAASGVERLYAGGITSVAAPSASMSSLVPAGGYNMLALRSPFDNSISSPVQRRSEDYRSLPDKLSRPTSSSDTYGREAMLHSPKGASSAQWRAPGSSRMPESSYSGAGISHSDGLRAYPGRFNYAIKEDPDAPSQFAPPPPPFFSSTNEPVDRTYPSRRPVNEHDAQFYRSDLTQTPEAHSGGGQAERSIAQGAPQYRFPWERQEEEMSYVHPGGPGGWNGAESTSSGATAQSSEYGRRDYPRACYPDMGYANPTLSSGLPSMAMVPSGTEASTEADLLQSEFFIEAMRPRGDEACWANLDPCMLTAQSAERVRVESGHEPSQHCSDASLAPQGPSVSPSGRSTAAADSYFAVDFRGLYDQTAPAEPPNAGQVEQIMAELGIDLSASQGAAADGSQSFSSQGPFVQPDIAVSAAPLIPSQGAAPWATERFAPTTSGFHLPSLSQSQAHSSQSSIYLPSLTASQNEYLGPNATSHRRTMDRVMSSASMAFDATSQPRASHRRTPSLAGELDESIGKNVVGSGLKSETQETPAHDETANFHKPHDSSPSQRAARDEEGGRKSACVEDHPQQPCPLPDVCRTAAFREQDAVMISRQESENATTETEADPHANPALAAPAPATTGTAATVMGPPRQDHGPARESNDKADMDIDKPPLPEDTQQRNSSASIATSAVSGDQLQLVVERFRVFAQLCQDHMHPSAEMLDCLAPLIPKVIDADAPFFHPKMVGSQKVHSPEEAFALLSLASLRCSDPHLKEEGHRLICFLYGAVMLSYKHTLHLGEKLQSLLNCFLLIGLHGMRQTTSDLWHKFEEHRESILLDVLRAETRNASLDPAMDRIEAEKLQDLPDEDLFMLWERWYEHESRKRTLLLCAILDSQSSCHFSPFQIDLSARPGGPRCQFLFAHVHEPCPDNVFLCWPPRTWATRLVTSVSLPSARVAEIAFHDGQPASIAACLTEQLLRPHVAHAHGTPAYPRFRPSFDFGAGGDVFQSSKLPRSVSDRRENARSAASAPYVEVADSSGLSARSSRRASLANRHKEGHGEGHEDRHEDDHDEGQTAPEVRIVSQLYMLALLEAVHGAWMTDSGWYQTPAWGATALPEQLDIDVDDFDLESASLTDLPGWRVGHTLHATQVAHALMNWSEMFSGWNDGCQTKGDEAAAKLGLKITDDAHQSTIRWQTIFLGLCAPLQSLCFYLDPSKRVDDVSRERHRRVKLLLRSWVESAYCRRALVHASTILTLLCAAKMKDKNEKLGPATSHAVYMSLVVLVVTNKLLAEEGGPLRRAATSTGPPFEELIATKQVWSTLVKPSKEGNMQCEGKAAEASDARKDDSDLADSEDWLRVRFWHRKFQFLGLAGIFREHEQDGSQEVYADWRMSVSAGAVVGGSVGALRAAHLRPRWSSFAGEGRWPGARRETIQSHHAPTAGNDHRRSSNAAFGASQPDPDRDLLRRHMRNTIMSTNTNASTETRRWILQGVTHHATFCGLALVDKVQESEANTSRERSDADKKVLNREHLRELVMWVRDDEPAWCFSQEYTSLLLGALQEAQAAQTGDSLSASTSHEQPQTAGQ
ncbi:related to Cys(2)His(2) zinc finger transcriptional activator [Ustilago trichophora]|uniref:Related to Cys(2)His(2) zinc finger transcriptional activator n=1 Tax=Ustilago trichophora TaxID=86804 RepID=A0A5C3EPI1_9BASI|nr:related to Cys(2)His(2) zinc finger transcriptional activator [Ustilago trichophora]